MQLSKEDMFCEGQQTATTAAASTNVLDFGKHGDDVLNKLFWSLFVAAVTGVVDKTLTVAWETSDYEGFVDGSNNASATTVFSKTIAATDLVAGAYPIRNEALPKGLKRYNRLKFTSGASSTYYPKVTAFVHDGRDEGTPFKGL